MMSAAGATERLRLQAMAHEGTPGERVRGTVNGAHRRTPGRHRRAAIQASQPYATALRCLVGTTVGGLLGFPASDISGTRTGLTHRATRSGHQMLTNGRLLAAYLRLRGRTVTAVMTTRL
jgi:hypothetical protein